MHSIPFILTLFFDPLPLKFLKPLLLKFILFLEIVQYLSDRIFKFYSQLIKFRGLGIKIFLKGFHQFCSVFRRQLNEGLFVQKSDIAQIFKQLFSCLESLVVTRWINSIKLKYLFNAVTCQKFHLYMLAIGTAKQSLFIQFYKFRR